MITVPAYPQELKKWINDLLNENQRLQDNLTRTQERNTQLVLRNRELEEKLRFLGTPSDQQYRME